MTDVIAFQFRRPRDAGDFRGEWLYWWVGVEYAERLLGSKTPKEASEELVAHILRTHAGSEYLQQAGPMTVQNAGEVIRTMASAGYTTFPGFGTSLKALMTPSLFGFDVKEK